MTPTSELCSYSTPDLPHMVEEIAYRAISRYRKRAVARSRSIMATTAADPTTTLALPVYPQSYRGLAPREEPPPPPGLPPPPSLPQRRLASSSDRPLILPTAYVTDDDILYIVQPSISYQKNFTLKTSTD